MQVDKYYEDKKNPLGANNWSTVCAICTEFDSTSIISGRGYDENKRDNTQLCDNPEKKR